MALFNINLGTQDVREHEISVTAAAKIILKRALEAPLSAIVSNSGESATKVIAELSRDKREKWIGFNALTNKICDLKEVGIIDPLKVTKTAFTNAISVAANYLTVGAAITELPENKSKPGMPGGMGMGDMDM